MLVYFYLRRPSRFRTLPRNRRTGLLFRSSHLSSLRFVRTRLRVSAALEVFSSARTTTTISSPRARPFSKYTSSPSSSSSSLSTSSSVSPSRPRLLSRALLRRGFIGVGGGCFGGAMFGVGDDGASDASIFVVVVSVVVVVSSVNAFLSLFLVPSFHYCVVVVHEFWRRRKRLSKVVFFFFLVVVLSPPPKGSLLDVDDIAKASSRNFLFRSIDRYYG